MIYAQWRARRANRNLIDQLHGKIVAAARRPALYADLHAPDTAEGRFEMVVLHAGLARNRLMRDSQTGVEIAHALADSVFRHFDVALREIGYGDVAVAKRLKRMAEAFYGRCKAYDEALEDTGVERLAEALARNVYGQADVALAPNALRLARFVKATAEALGRLPIETVAAGELAFPDSIDEPRAAQVGNER